jgi:hypothetical protein
MSIKNQMRSSTLLERSLSRASLEPEFRYAIEAIEMVITWIQDFSTDIENAAVSELHLASKRNAQQPTEADLLQSIAEANNSL